MARSLSGYIRNKQATRDSPSRVRLLREVALKPTGPASAAFAPAKFSAAGMTARYVPVDTDGFGYEWVGRSHYLALHDLHLKEGETFTHEHGADHRRDLRGTLTFIPAGCRIWGWSVPRTTGQSFTALYLDPEVVEQEVAQKLPQLPSTPNVYFGNPSLRSTLQKIQRTLSGVSRYEALYLESLCLLAALELCVIEKDKLAIATDSPGHLPKAAAQRVSEYVDANLGEDIGLNDLAAIAGLSRFHFLRAFKKATQETPYQYLLRRRIEHSEALLMEGELSVAEVAAAVGFKDSTRFIRAFRNLKGVTPGRFRE
jgi:AraC family transcriptional regulator